MRLPLPDRSVQQEAECAKLILPIGLACNRKRGLRPDVGCVGVFAADEGCEAVFDEVEEKEEDVSSEIGGVCGVFI
jgi:hypothetical protein